MPVSVRLFRPELRVVVHLVTRIPVVSVGL